MSASWSAEGLRRRLIWQADLGRQSFLDIIYRCSFAVKSYAYEAFTGNFHGFMVYHAEGF